MVELKPCPFCRGECELRHEDLTDTPWGMMRNHWVECNRDRGEHSCLYRGAVGDTPAQASARHNALPREERWVPVSEGVPLTIAEKPDARYDVVSRGVVHTRFWFTKTGDRPRFCNGYMDSIELKDVTHYRPHTPPRGPEAIDD